MQAMILAAGFGTRLLPHTLIRPKPLFPVLNQPLLLLTIRRLKNLGFDHIVVNCHHLRQQMVTALAGISGVHVQEEEVILGTGGGLRRAAGLLRNEPLLVTNGDIYHTVDFLELYRHHQSSGQAVTLAMHDYPRFNMVAVDKGRITGFSHAAKSGNLAFTGLHVIEPDSLLEIEEGGFSCILDHYRNLLARGVLLDCYRTDGSFWTDMGTEEDYLALHSGLLSGTIPRWLETGPGAERQYIDQNAHIGQRVTMEDWVCVGRARIGEGCHLQRVVVWDDVIVPPSSRLADALISAK